MNKNFENVYLSELSKSKLSQAYCLARMAGDPRDEGAWLDRIKRWQGTTEENKKGVIALENADGYVIALLYYKVSSNPELGRVLEVRDLTVPLMFRSSIIEHFVLVLDQLAGMLSCWTIFLPTPYDSPQNKSAITIMAELEGFQKETSGIYRYLPVQREPNINKVSL
jgi:hypothetical protein